MHQIPNPTASSDEKSPTCPAQVAQPTEPAEGLSLSKAVIMITAISSISFCVSLDGTILATAIPHITDQFHSLEDIGWYGSSYLLATSSVQLIFGKLYTLYPDKILFMVGVAVFEIGSLICGLAPKSAVLIIGRSISGVGAACIICGRITIVTNNVPLEKRPIYIGILGSVQGIASVTGPLLGGALTDYASWRWCFFLNIPLGIISCIGVILVIPKSKNHVVPRGVKQHLKQLDPGGAFLLAAGVICLLLALQQGGTQYSWDNWRIITCFIASCVLLILFGFLQTKLKDRATLPPHIIRNRNILGVVEYTLCISGGLFIVTYYLPLWFQAVKGVSATKSGIMCLPTDLSFTLTILVSGFLLSLVGHFTFFLMASSIATTVGSGMLSTLNPDSGIAMWLGYQVLTGVGAGLGSQNAIMVTQTAVPQKDVPIAIAVNAFAAALANSVFLLVGQSVFQNQLRHNLSFTDPSLDISDLTAGATLLKEKVDKQRLPQALEAYSLAVTQTFYVGVAVSALSLLGAVAINSQSIKRLASRLNRGSN